jgi:hypothetical protein
MDVTGLQRKQPFTVVEHLECLRPRRIVRKVRNGARPLNRTPAETSLPDRKIARSMDGSFMAGADAAMSCSTEGGRRRGH